MQHGRAIRAPRLFPLTACETNIEILPCSPSLLGAAADCSMSLRFLPNFSTALVQVRIAAPSLFEPCEVYWDCEWKGTP